MTHRSLLPLGFLLLAASSLALRPQADVRMIDALSRMGSIVVPYLQKATKHKNIRVRKQAWNVIAMIQARFQTADKTVPNMSNVLTQLRWLKNKPSSIDAKRAMKILKGMGTAAIPHLISAAENKNLDLNAVALGALSFVSGRNTATTWRSTRRFTPA